MRSVLLCLAYALAVAASHKCTTSRENYRLVIEVSTRNITLDAAFFEQCNSTVNNKAAFEEVVFTQNSPVGTITHMTPG